ncbi:uncharacterized protein LOC107051973 isoform X1 [Gallus gallus]|uniref:uncharacterized protein LOC107051973 isoform X1 n=1 Tax=Gallus gallus TaxID=9031 RepID=UPI001AE7E8AA|nr:uncharacterized protein LOC107051973 isoform X1 [Gallus gallus]
MLGGGKRRRVASTWRGLIGRAEPSRAVPRRAVPCHAKPSRAEPSRAEPSSPAALCPRRSGTARHGTASASRGDVGRPPPHFFYPKAAWAVCGARRASAGCRSHQFRAYPRRSLVCSGWGFWEPRGRGLRRCHSPNGPGGAPRPPLSPPRRPAPWLRAEPAHTPPVPSVRLRTFRRGEFSFKKRHGSFCILNAVRLQRADDAGPERDGWGVNHRSLQWPQRGTPCHRPICLQPRKDQAALHIRSEGFGTKPAPQPSSPRTRTHLEDGSGCAQDRCVPLQGPPSASGCATASPPSPEGSPDRNLLPPEPNADKSSSPSARLHGETPLPTQGQRGDPTHSLSSTQPLGRPTPRS